MLLWAARCYSTTKCQMAFMNKIPLHWIMRWNVLFVFLFFYHWPFYQVLFACLPLLPFEQYFLWYKFWQSYRQKLRFGSNSVRSWRFTSVWFRGDSGQPPDISGGESSASPTPSMVGMECYGIRRPTASGYHEQNTSKAFTNERKIGREVSCIHSPIIRSSVSFCNFYLSYSIQSLLSSSSLTGSFHLLHRSWLHYSAALV